MNNIETTSDRTIEQLTKVLAIVRDFTTSPDDMAEVVRDIFDTELRLIWEPNDDDPNAQHVWDYFKACIAKYTHEEPDNRNVNEILNALEYSITTIHPPNKQ